MANLTGIYNQSIFDLIIRQYGSLEFAGQFLANNPDINSVTESAENKTFSYTANTTDQSVVAFQKSNSTFSTYISNEELLTEGRSFDSSWNFSWGH